MRVIICGSRKLTRADYPLLERAIRIVQRKRGWVITEVVCGEASGGDALGKRWARENGVPVKPFEPDWGDPDDPNPEAGHNRNESMAVYAADPAGPGGACLALWDGHSPGTRDMLSRAKAHKLERYVASTGDRVPKTY